MRRTPLHLAWLIVGAGLVAPLVAASTDVEILDVNLSALIEQSAEHPERFAVNVPHRVSSATHGAWSSTAGASTWSYSVRIPTAVSMSFHAAHIGLPASASLSVTAGKASVIYGAQDINRQALWGRPLIGDTLTFTLRVPDAQRSEVRFEIESLQAGYRALGGGVPDHPKFKSLQPRSAAAALACIENYSCNQTEANRGPAHATVAILIGNTAQCTGTLLNNARQDGTPLILTARHCQNGELGGGGTIDPARSVTIYWNAVSSCGQALGSLYGSATEAQAGAVTRVEQQDVWLMQLDGAPRIADPYYAGWDATGATWVGGYSVHHAMGFNKRFTAWHGQALLQRVSAAALRVGYDSDFWGLVNAVGSIGAGASGGAVFDSNHRVVGSASLGYLLNGPGSEGVCPVNPPPAPTPASVTAQYTALSAVYNSTSDATSRTGNTTVRTILDPDGAGLLTQNGMGIAPLSLVASASTEVTEQPITLSWNAPWAQSCMASGGRPGDGWTGQLPPTGSRQVSSAAGGSVQYTLDCAGGDTRGRASATVSWQFIPPLLSFVGPSGPILIGSSFDLQWDANVQPCIASDGNAADGWAGTKSRQGAQTLSANQLGVTTYSLTCGAGARIASAQVSVEVLPPFVELRADATRLRTGSQFNIWWTGNTGESSCNGSGGVPSWPQNTQQAQSSGSAISTSSTPGIFTYTMTCTGAGQSVSSSFTIEFVTEPATQSLAAVALRQEIYPPGTAFSGGTDNLQWTSNRGFCTLASIGPNGNRSVDLKGQYPAGTAAAVEVIAGIYTYEFTCLGTISRATIEWYTPNPQVAIREISGASVWVGGHPYQLLYSSNTLPCTKSGGVPGDGWVEDRLQVTAPRAPGTYTYSVTCGVGTSIGRHDFVVTVPAPAVTLTATPANPSVSRPATLQWQATAFPCTANADGAGVLWGGANMNYAGQVFNQQTSPGTYTYTIRCGAGAHTASASTQITFRATEPTVLQASATAAAVNEPVTLTWIADSGTCEADGGTLGDGWRGTKPLSGSATVTSRFVGLVGYVLNCGSGGASVNVTYNAVAGADAGPKPSVTLTVNRTSQTAGQSVTLTWSSQNADACFAGGGNSGDGWAGSLSLSGTMNVTRSSAGSSTYSITCTGATPASTAEATVVFSTAPGSGGGGSSSGGGGGGGSLDRYALWLLLLVLLGSRYRCGSSAIREDRRYFRQDRPQRIG